MFKNYISLIVLVFLLGWVGNNVYSEVYKNNYQLNLDRDNVLDTTSFIVSKEVDSPKDRVKENQIHVYDDTVIIEVENPEWSRFTDTNSMDPLIDMGSNAIHVVPKSEDDIIPGDVVAYESDFSEGTIIHRVVGKGQDEEGIYFILKGDNNPNTDPGKVRFSQIKRVLVAIIY